MPAKIMVVDDEPDLELLISQKYRKKIKDEEIHFVFAGDGMEALEKLKKNDGMDIILTDINMPKMDGLTLLTKLNESYPLLKSVIVSAYGDMSNIRTALNRGAFDFVTKPIDFQDLEITINKALKEANTLKQAVRDRDQLMTIQKELDIARTIQETIVPRTFPPFPDRKDFEILAKMITAKEVGGDLYDFFMIDDDHLGFVIGDVSGKGVPAALFMAVSRTLLKATALKGLPPNECFQQVNRLLYLESVPSMFVTMFYGILNTKTGEIDYCNGGHNPPFLIRNNGKVEPLSLEGGLILGAMEEFDFQSNQVKLDKNESLFLYTDGVTEAMNQENEEFGEERLKAGLSKLNGKPIENLINSVIEDVNNFVEGAPQADDITAMALRYLGK
jgi:sigma-B regulation protein RsbU (phosphoserine phosphatase)